MRLRQVPWSTLVGTFMTTPTALKSAHMSTINSDIQGWKTTRKTIRKISTCTCRITYLEQYWDFAEWKLWGLPLLVVVEKIPQWNPALLSEAQVSQLFAEMISGGALWVIITNVCRLDLWVFQWYNLLTTRIDSLSTWLQELVYKRNHDLKLYLAKTLTALSFLSPLN